MILRKLIYLLQLEEYQSERYSSWLKKYPIEKLEERKNKLHFTFRVILTFFLSGLFLPFTKKEISVKIANDILTPIFKLLEEIVVIFAKIKLKFFPSLIKIVITGSYGKTSFKELLSWVLESKYLVIKTPENINTRIGIALFILKQLKLSHQILIVEAAAYQPGDIKKICQLVKPSFGIITVFGLMHLERFKTLQNIYKTKLEIISFIKNKENLFIPKKFHKFIDFQKTAITIAQKLDIPTSIIKERIQKFKNPLHRLTEKKINSKIIILDDTYNSNPLGFKKALEKLNSYKKFQKIVVTPGMIEFGEKQSILNQELASLAAKIADVLIIVGETNKKALLKGAKKENKENLKIFLISKNENLEEKISSYFRPPAVILLENDLPDHYF